MTGTRFTGVPPICALKLRRSPNTPARQMPRDLREDDRNVASALARTEAYEQSRRESKKASLTGCGCVPRSGLQVGAGINPALDAVSRERHKVTNAQSDPAAKSRRVLQRNPPITDAKINGSRARSATYR